MTDPVNRRYRLGDVLLVDRERGCVLRGGEEIRLRPQSFRTLLYLLEQRPRLLSRDELMAHIWSDVAVTPDSVVQCISEIRRAIGDGPRQARYLKTVHGRGYRFVGPVEEEPEESAKAGAGDPTAAAPPETGQSTDDQAWTTAAPAIGRLSWGGLTRGQAASVVVLLVMAAGAIGLWVRPLWPPRVAVGTAGSTRVLVTPFENHSREGELERLCQGLADMVITGLSRVDGLSVVSRDHLVSVIDRFPFEIEAYLRLGYLLRTDRAGAELEVFRRGLTMDPDIPDLWNAIGFSLEDPSEAIDAHRRYVALAPDEPNAHDSLGLSAVARGDAERALSLFRGLDTGAAWNVDGWRTCMADAYLELGRVEEAAAEYRRLITLNPRYPFAHLGLGRACGRLGDSR